MQDSGVPTTFRGNEAAALRALREGAALIDRSDWGRIRLSGAGRAAFLHGQSTADVNALAPGQGCDTVLTTALGRCIDLATLYCQSGGLLLITSPGMGHTVKARLEKYIFPGDEVEVTDFGAKTSMLSLLGPAADEMAAAMGLAELEDAPEGTHQLLSLGRRPVVAARGAGLGVPGYTFIVDEAAAGDLWRALTAKVGFCVLIDIVISSISFFQSFSFSLLVCSMCPASISQTRTSR
jgi:tRNA-modifying protein YgfZ